MNYACVAATKERARCRNTVEKPGEMCELHQKMRDEGKEVMIALRPDTILLRFNVNPGWAQKFEEAGIPRSSPSEVALEEKHIAQAQAIDREAYRYRDIADSGVPVFGEKGVSNISIIGLLSELEGAGYKPRGVHIRTRTQKKFDVLVIPFSRETTGNNLLPLKAIEFIRDHLKLSCWGFVHIWANPPDSQGKIPHTINLGHREVDKSPQGSLRFNQGLWAIESA